MTERWWFEEGEVVRIENWGRKDRMALLRVTTRTLMSKAISLAIIDSGGAQRHAMSIPIDKAGALAEGLLKAKEVAELAIKAWDNNKARFLPMACPTCQEMKLTFDGARVRCMGCGADHTKDGQG